MKRLLFHILLIGLSALFSWWFLLRVPPGWTPPAAAEPPGELTLTVLPQPTSPTGEAADPRPVLPPPTAALEHPAPEPEDVEPEDVEPEDAHLAAAGEPDGEEPEPPPPEDGTPDGDPEEEARSEPQPAPRADPSARATRELARIVDTPRLMEQAMEEVRGVSRQGFRTTFLCSAREQLEIARYFGEPVVLVPRAGLRPGGEYYHRLALSGEPAIVRVGAPAPLTEYRQYRDLFAFDYDSLPHPLRELRRRVFIRRDIYLFAALIPPREWGLVIVRRNAALDSFNRNHDGPERTLEDVRSFTMRYVRLPGGAFDIEVDKISFGDEIVADANNGEIR